MKNISLMAVVLLTSLNCIVLAETYYVDDANGNNDWNGLAESYEGGNVGPKKTISGGVEVAVEGDTVIVADGIYRGGAGYALIKANIVLKSAGGAEKCKIVGGGSSAASLIIQTKSNEGEPKAVIDGFTIQWDALRALSIGRESNAIVQNCTFAGCYTQLGVVTCSQNSTPTIINCNFFNNAGIISAAIVSEEGAHPVITGCKIDASTNSWHQLCDGAVLCADGGGGFSSVTIEDCEITGFTVPGVCLAGNATGTIFNSTIQGGQGGIIIIQVNSSRCPIISS